MLDVKTISSQVQTAFGEVESTANTIVHALKSEIAQRDSYITELETFVNSVINQVSNTTNHVSGLSANTVVEGLFAKVVKLEKAFANTVKVDVEAGLKRVESLVSPTKVASEVKSGVETAGGDVVKAGNFVENAVSGIVNEIKNGAFKIGPVKL